MATTTATHDWYNQASERLGDGGIVLDSNTFEIRLFSSAYVFDATQTTSADLNNELAGNGYTPIVLTGVTWNRVGPVTTFSSNTAVWTATGGSIVARRFVILDTTADLLLFSGLLDMADADVTTTDTNTLTYQPNASGSFTASLVNA